MSASDRRRTREELKLARQGAGRAKQWKQAGDASIYTEVSEEKYKDIVRNRLRRDDFVEDDGVDGYADDGMDDFGDQMQESEDEGDIKRRKKARSKAAKSKQRPPPPEPAPISAYRSIKSEAMENEFLEGLLGSMNAAPLPKPNPRKRKNSPVRREANFSSFRDNGGASSDGPDDFFEGPSFAKRREAVSSDDEAFQTPAKRFKAENGASVHVMHTATQVSNLHVDDNYDAFENEFDPIELDMDVDGPINVKEDSPVKLSKLHPPGNGFKTEAANSVSKKEEDPPIPSWISVHTNLPVMPRSDQVGGVSNSLHSTRVQALEDDGVLRMFWLDYLELDGKIYLVGKVLDKAINQYVSACVTIENLERNLFVLPRRKRVEDGSETDIEPTKEDVQREFTDIRRAAGIGGCRVKWVKRKYAFEEPDVPKEETDWLKVHYPFALPPLHSDTKSPSIARIFGTNTSAFELFVLKRKIMGPCWLQIKGPNIENKGVSWCKLEATVFNPKDISPITRPGDLGLPDIPPLTVMSVSVRTVVNHKDSKREIVTIALRVWENSQIEDTTPIEAQSCIATTYVRPLEKFPKGFEAYAKQHNRSTMLAVASERLALNQFLVSIFRYDPDVIIGHEFLGISLDVLLHRMRDLKADHWSRISRFKRKGWPLIGKQGSNLRFLQGRLLCDLASDGAKGMIASTTWSLTEMVLSQLGIQRPDIDPDDTAMYFDCETSTAMRLMEFVQHCETDAYFQMAIASKVQILPLTRQLTNLAGNSWNKTLNGGRAERNEYILLHEFHSLKYICPDKTWGKKSAAAVKAEVEEGDTAAITSTSTKSKRDKYKGGLVFEPKRGLWDKIILVMDFNSLYPSIIQEYNIDFTTVDRTVHEGDDEDKIPDVPPEDVRQGVLPRLIAELVNRRKRVKALKKDPHATKAQLQQWEIKQQALKLTANSMYGCLGFEHSRFYAKPLAALTTAKGREILTNTRELAESMDLDVVYGDTDSVFVNSNKDNVREALEIAFHFKKAVNDRYRLLEIDVDGVFQRLLLLQKKKYAAVKVENDKTVMEVKGLDMKRREYCVLSKNTSKEVLGHILSGNETEVVVERIHDYLAAIAQNIRNGYINLDDFIIYKRLGKSPEEYEDAKGQPHVQVALRMKGKGQSARAGDVVPYIFCLGDDGMSSKTAQHDRAYHPEEIRRSNGQLKVDYDFYLSQQILPPVERLCDPIEGTDRSRLAECLGLDPSRFQSHTSGGGEGRDLGMLDSQIPDRERFRNCDPFIVTCRACKSGRRWYPPHEAENTLITPHGVVCGNKNCSAPITRASLQTQLEIQVREHVSTYYKGWMVCDDAVCGRRTRQMRVYGRKCPAEGCRGVMSFEYDDTKLYTQLLYYSSLFDKEKISRSTLGKSNFDHVEALVVQNEDILDALYATTEQFLDECGRRWVDLKDLFSFMTIKPKRTALRL